jgi:hypothetical protein
MSTQGVDVRSAAGATADAAHPAEADVGDAELPEFGGGLSDALPVENLDDRDPDRDLPPYGLSDVGSGTGVTAAAAGHLVVFGGLVNDPLPVRLGHGAVPTRWAAVGVAAAAALTRNDNGIYGGRHE